METFLTKEEWATHVKTEEANQAVTKDHGERIKHVEMAMFGDDLFPETVKNAILPTMTRLNIWLDMVGAIWRVGLGAVGGLAALAVGMKALGWL
jgi:hypothetical protein